MSAVTKPSGAPGRAAIPPYRGAPSESRIRNDLPSTSRGALDLLLVFGTLAVALGLAVVMASLTPSADALGDPSPVPPRFVLASGAASEPGPGAAADDRAPPTVMSPDRVGKAAAADFPRVSAAGPSVSPLYPQNGVTLWDRIRVSAKRDPRAFLLGTAIQIHTPAIAATPGPRSAPPPCCPRT